VSLDVPLASVHFLWALGAISQLKRIWRDVMVASLGIQLMALMTPILTQIVIDRVVVHQTLNTLVVIGIALAALLLFNAVMSWIRQPYRERAGPARAAVQHRQPDGDDQPGE
jgi:ABC-type bacteriocin/lantibiotic exporter with double-glycine peptidase domain